MKANSPLARQFLARHPEDAARALERVPAAAVAPLLADTDSETAAAVLQHMLPREARECLELLPVRAAGAMVTHMLPVAAARALRGMDTAAVGKLLRAVPLIHREQVRRQMHYPSYTVGGIMDPAGLFVFDQITVEDVLRRIGDSGYRLGGELFLIDSAHHLSGVVPLGALFKAPGHRRLQAIMDRHPPALRADTPLDVAVVHRGWKRYRTLPIIERDRTAVGLLEFERLSETLAEGRAGNRPPDDAFGSLLEVAAAYWLAVLAGIHALLSPGEVEDEQASEP